MPVTKSEMMFFAAGAAFGAAAGANYPASQGEVRPDPCGRLGRGEFGRWRFVCRGGQAGRRKGRSRPGRHGRDETQRREQRNDRASLGIMSPPIAQNLTSRISRFVYRIRRRRASMDLAIRFPALGRIHLESRFLFSEPHDPNCRRFLERVFQARKSPRSRSRVSRVPVRFLERNWGFAPRTHTLKQVVERVTRVAEPRKGSAGRVHHRQGKSSNGALGSNGRAGSNGRISSNGRASPTDTLSLKGLSGSSQLRRGTPGSDHHLGHAGP